MRKIALILMFLPLWVNAQVEEEAKEFIDEFFVHLNAKNAKGLEGIFVDKASMMSVYTTANDSVIIHHEEVAKFVEAVAKGGGREWKEEIYNTQINMDKGMASVWCDYKFYLDGKFSHCGVNAFHLVEMKGEWKILQIVDTRRKDNCNK